MSRLLRIFLYTDPSRQHYTQLHTDQEVDDLPQVSYAQRIRIGDDSDDPSTWLTYVVAYLPRMKQETDPDRPGETRIVYEVYVAREADWPSFDWPEGLGQVE